MRHELLRHGRGRPSAAAPLSRGVLVIVGVIGVALLAPYAGTATDQVELTGTVVHEHGDNFEAGASVPYTVLETATDRYTLEGVRARGLREGQRVRVRGARRGGTVVLGSNSTVTDQRVAAADGTGSATSTAGTAALTSSSTAVVSKKVAVLLINFQAPTPSATPSPTLPPTASPTAPLTPTANPAATVDPSATPRPSTSPTAPPTAPPTATPVPPSPTPPPEPWTPAQVRGIYFTNTKSASSYFSEVSNGRISLSGQVYGWFTLKNSTATCDYNGWAKSARDAAAAAGVNISSFTNYAYAFPKVDACSWGGLGSVNGPHSWINGNNKMNLYVATHELGHNLGTHHAATLSCSSGGVRVALSSKCTSNEYGDPFDIMGGNGSYSATFHVNNWARRLIGALTTSDQQTVSVNGVYSVANAQASGGTPRILRVLRPAGDYFYLEHRRPYGLFDTFTATAPVVGGVTIRLAPNTQRIPSQLIDTTPETTTFNDAALAPGRTFVDPLSGITITSLAMTSSRATLRIQVGPDTVAPGAPGSLVATASGPNSIGLSWTAASDDLQVVSYLVQRNGIHLGAVPGLAYADGGLAQAATYGYTVRAVDAAGNVGPAASVSRYLPDTVAPSAVAGVSASQTAQREVSIAWGGATDNIGVTGYRVTRNGKTLVNTLERTFVDRTPIDGFSYGYAVQAYDAAGNLGSPVTATVSLPDITPPSAPGGLATASTGSATARIEWASATDNVAVTGYTVTRSGVVVAVLPASARSFSETLPEGTYYYEVRAFDAAANFGPAMPAQAKVVLQDLTPPSVPLGLTATSLSGRYVRLSWLPSTDDRSGTIRYALFRGTKRIARLTGTTFTDRPAYVGTYKYKVRAIDAAGNKSKFSPVVLGKAVKRV